MRPYHEIDRRRHLPPKVKRSLTKLGADIALARKKRKLTTMMIAERTGVAKSTYLKLEKGDPSIALGTYAMTFFVLGFGDAQESRARLAQLDLTAGRGTRYPSSFRWDLARNWFS